MFSSSGPHLRCKSTRLMWWGHLSSDGFWVFPLPFPIIHSMLVMGCRRECSLWPQNTAVVRVLKRGPCSSGPSRFVRSELKDWANNSYLVPYFVCFTDQKLFLGFWAVKSSRPFYGMGKWHEVRVDFRWGLLHILAPISLCSCSCHPSEGESTGPQGCLTNHLQYAHQRDHSEKAEKREKAMREVKQCPQVPGLMFGFKMENRKHS